MDPHCFDADPDTAQNLDADPDPDPGGRGGGVGQQKMCIPPGKILGPPLTVPLAIVSLYILLAVSASSLISPFLRYRYPLVLTILDPVSPFPMEFIR